MSQQKINYVFSAVLVVLALILGYFGMTLPVQPEIPSPLPTPDISGLVTYEDLALLQRQVETLGTQSFTVSGDDSYSTECYQKQGGSEWIADDGCTWGVLDGATLEVQSGSTVDLQAALSSSVGAVTISDHLDVQNTLNYGTSNLWPIGSEDSNFQFSWGSQTITGTAVLSTQKVGSPTAAWCSISSETFTATHCSTLIVGTTVTASVWLSNSTASPVGVAVDWLVIGIP